jgi:hypothetical protein
MDRDDPSYKGQRGYNRLLLAIYDPWVLGFMTRAVWKVPIPPVVERYRRLLGRRHLDVGPGTGYFLEKAAPPDGTEITLLDPNPNVLRKASRRLAAMHPITVEADVMKPLPVRTAWIASSGVWPSSTRARPTRSPDRFTPLRQFTATCFPTLTRAAILSPTV